jgi:hypothetical protein
MSLSLRGIPRVFRFPIPDSRFPRCYGDLGFAVRGSPPDDDPVDDEPVLPLPEPPEVLLRGEPLLPLSCRSFGRV